MRTRRTRRPGLWPRVPIALLAALAMFFIWRAVMSPKRQARSSTRAVDRAKILVTGYCNCGRCCGWELSWLWFGEPVYNYGPLKGKPKKVGRTARGTMAKKGTVAADTKVFPFGTRLEIPGYGIGVVEDVGGAIKGRHIDVWFPTHEEAVRWGRRELTVKVVSGDGAR